ncbi:MAG TPA: hypothetical protein VI818_04230, partial [Candidatus Thermoplasmatota archaeon]|nr:hypothetical protein [Candidatus Thermoplasmatota archaeon]
IEHMGRWSRFFGEALRKARERHDRGEGLIARHGAAGLFGLAMIPVGFYSPLVIAALGQMGGLRPRSVIVAVGGAIAIMTTVWVAMLNAGLDQAAAIDPRLPWIVGIGLTVLFVGKSVVSFFWRRSHTSPGPQPGRDPEKPAP